MLLALVVLMFSLESRPRPLSSPIATTEFVGQRALLVGAQVETQFGSRIPGTPQSRDAAAFVAERFAEHGFTPSLDRFEASTTLGKRKLVNVLGERIGSSDRKVVVVASRDGLGGRLRAVGAAETGALIELARVLDGRNLAHTVVLVSTDAGIHGGAGAVELAQQIEGPVDAVVALRNLAVPRAQSRTILSAQNSRRLPNQLLLRTAQEAVRQETGRSVTGEHVFGQFARLAFPIALGEQAQMTDAAKIGGAIAFSPGGEPLAKPDDLAEPGQGTIQNVGQYGRAVLRVISALDQAQVPRAQLKTALVARDKLLPGWALSLFVATLIFPLLVAGVDGLARARRLGQRPATALLWPLLWALPVVLAALSARLLATSGAVSAAAVPADGTALAAGSEGLVMVLVPLVVAGTAWTALVRLLPQAAREHPSGSAALALALTACVTVVWLFNPLTAALLLPLAHILALALLADARPARMGALLIALTASLPLFAVILFYLTRLDLGLFDGANFFSSLVAGGYVSPVSVLIGALTVGTVACSVIQLVRPQPPENNPPNPGRSVLSHGRSPDRAFG